MKNRYIILIFIILSAGIISLAHIGRVANERRLADQIESTTQQVSEAQQKLGSTSAHVGPDSLYPNPTLTGGKADTLSFADLTARYNGKTYSQAHRNVPQAEHDQVYNEYNVPKDQRNAIGGEVDHFYPLCAGGSNDIANLWYQPATNQWNGKDFGYHAKDKLESYICIQVKAGKLDPKTAFQKMTTDWVAFYLEVQNQLSAQAQPVQ